MRIRQWSSPETSQEVRNHNQGEKNPDGAFPAPPAALKLNIRADSQLIVDFRDAIPHRRQFLVLFSVCKSSHKSLHFYSVLLMLD
jgi:hypothetical protein